MQNPIQKFRQSSIVFKKPVILSELQLPYISIFFAETSRTLPTHQCLQNGLRDFFNFVQILSYLQKLKRPGFYMLFFIFLLVSQDLNKIKKITNTLSQTLLSRKCVQNFSKTIKLYVSWSSSKFSIFQTKRPGFLEIIDFALIWASDFTYLDQHYQIIKNLVHKNQFQMNHARHLNKITA